MKGWGHRRGAKRGVCAFRVPSSGFGMAFFCVGYCLVVLRDLADLSASLWGSTTTDNYLPIRLAKLRNRGLDLASGQYISYLDDDNEFTPDHISSLEARINADQLDAVHSYRRLFHMDGRPFVEPLLPWGSTLEEARRIYEQFVEVEILMPRSNIMRDQMFGDRLPKFHVRGTVDTSEWLIPTEVHRRFPFPTEFSEQERRYGLTDDNKLLNSFDAAKLKVGTTGRPTLLYYLGGYSSALVATWADVARSTPSGELT